MLPLDDLRWPTYVGGYHEAYDASEALGRLMANERVDEAIVELGNELCHQGDLGSASYAAVPWLVEFLHRSPLLNWRIAGLVLTIEFGRPFNGDQMPDELRND